MYTQCPNCDAIFRLQHAHLRAAGGHVRCSQCQHTFNAAKQRIERLPDEEELKAAEQDLQKNLQKKRKGISFFKFLFALLFASTLLAQYYWYNQADNLLQHPELRPWLEKVCAYVSPVFHCRLPMTRNLNAFKTEKHDLIADTNNPNISILHLVFSNQAHFPQAYPRVDIKISDRNQKLIALRHLMPSEYLPLGFELNQMGAGEQRHLKLNFNNVVPNMHSFAYQIDYQ